jgi:hypothetical protein
MRFVLLLTDGTIRKDILNVDVHHHSIYVRKLQWLVDKGAFLSLWLHIHEATSSLSPCISALAFTVKSVISDHYERLGQKQVHSRS